MKAFIEWIYSCSEWEFALLCLVTFYIIESFILSIIKAIKGDKKP